ncbi:MAG: flagellar hook-length control protein FliK [bacterium]
MLGNLALNLSVDAGLSLINDVMNAVSPPLSLQGNGGGGAGSGPAFGGQSGFGEILNNSVAAIKSANDPVTNSNYNNQGGNPAPVNQPVNAGVNTGNNYGGNPGGGNNIGGNSTNSVSAADKSTNNTVNSTNNNADAPSAAVQPSGNANPAAGNSAGPASGAKALPENKAKNVAVDSKKGTDGRTVYFIGNAVTDIAVQPVSVKKVNNGSNSQVGDGKDASGKDAGVGGTNVKSAAGYAAGLYRSQSQNQNNAAGKDSTGSSSGKTFLSTVAENAGRKITDNAVGQNIAAETANQSASLKIGDAAKTGGAAANKNSGDGSLQKAPQASLKVSLNTLNRSSQNNQNVLNSASKVNTNIDANNANIIDTAKVNTVNANTLIKDASVNAFNLNVLSGETKQALSGTSGKNSVNVNVALDNSGSVSVSDSGSGSTVSASGKTDGFISAAFSGINGPASGSGGNSGGLSLSGGNIGGLEDQTGETSASTAVNSVMFMLRKNVQSATITLNPASLGTVKINIALSNPNAALNSLNQSAAQSGSITINMLAQNEAAKNILQSSSDALQNALKNQGFSSINLNISTGSGYNNGNGNSGSETLKNPFDGANYGSGFSNGTAGSGAVPTIADNFAYRRNPNSLVDYFV